MGKKFKISLSRVRQPFTFPPLFFALILCAAAAMVRADEVQHLTVTQPGGFPGLPIMTGIEFTSNGVTITWDGPSGYYQLWQKPAATSQTWHKAGGLNLNRKATITSVTSNAFFRVSGPAPQYAGSQACIECHENIHTTEMDTRHARAFETLKQAHQDQNPACVACHVVGYKLPTGFISEAATPHLAGVQCESCHGAAGNHAANPDDFTVRPRAEIAGQVCGGCHTGAHHPTFDEWKGSGHFGVVEDMSAAGRISSCARCHSGSVRLEMIKGGDPFAMTNDANVGITCVTCHDPHKNRVWTNVLTQVVYTNQLRQALSSTNDFSLATSDTFAAKYDPNINVCAQCHNHRGATWTSSARAPHHSPQYNILLGTVGELDGGAKGAPAAHAFLDKQCVTCHMQKTEFASEAQPALTGHKFNVETYNACLQCHSLPEFFVDFTQSYVAGRIQQLKSKLDEWATTKAPAALRFKYGGLAWEYSAPGELSTGSAGPTSAEQAQIPDGIKKARFNLYIVQNDGSFGVHNGPHSISLLDAAMNWVQTELDK